MYLVQFTVLLAWYYLVGGLDRFFLVLLGSQRVGSMLWFGITLCAVSWLIMAHRWAHMRFNHCLLLCGVAV